MIGQPSHTWQHTHITTQSNLATHTHNNKVTPGNTVNHGSTIMTRQRHQNRTHSLSVTAKFCSTYACMYMYLQNRYVYIHTCTCMYFLEICRHVSIENCDMQEYCYNCWQSVWSSILLCASRQTLSIKISMFGRCKLYFDWSVHVGSCVAEVEKRQDGQTNGKPVHKRHVVDETVHVGGAEIH